MKVVHCKKEPYDIYIGRPSKWGNPFEIGPDGEREEVVEKYRAYVQHKIDCWPGYLDMIKEELKGKTLGCWCAPNACHGDILMELANAD